MEDSSVVVGDMIGIITIIETNVVNYSIVDVIVINNRNSRESS